MITITFTSSSHKDVVVEPRTMAILITQKANIMVDGKGEEKYAEMINT